jgi:hypothetical protein
LSSGNFLGSLYLPNSLLRFPGRADVAATLGIQRN